MKSIWLTGGNFGSFFVIVEVLYLHRSLLILSTFNAVIMVLSPSPITTPSDISSGGEGIDLQSRFANVSGVDQDNNDAADANLFLEDPFLSAATDSGLVRPTMPTTSIERSPVDGLLFEPSFGKSSDILGFIADSEMSGPDPGFLSNLTAGGELPSDPIFAEDGVVKKEDILGVEKVDVDPVSVGGGNENAYSLEKLLEEEELAVKPPFLRKREYIPRPSRFLVTPSPVVPKVEHPLVKEEAEVRPFQVPFQSIGISICDGKIGSSGLQACIAAVVPGTCS